MSKRSAHALLLAALIGAAFARSPLSAQAAPLTYELPADTAELKPGSGAKTAAACGGCHSVDYIATQPSQRGKAFWDAGVQKMIKVFKAPIDPQGAATITDYPAATY
jgi:hypothetical protein